MKRFAVSTTNERGVTLDTFYYYHVSEAALRKHFTGLGNTVHSVEECYTLWKE